MRSAAATVLLFCFLGARPTAVAASLCEAATSRRTCNQLTENGTTSYGRAANWGPADSLGQPTVCGSSPSSLATGCWGAATLLEAAGICREFDARLCTLDELLLNEAAGTGCGFDGKSVWSSSRSRCGPGHFFSVAGAANNAVEPPLGKHSTSWIGAPTCTAATTQLAVRCCGDATVLPPPACERSAATCTEFGWPLLGGAGATVCADQGSVHACASDPSFCERQLSRKCTATEANATNSSLVAGSCLCCADATPPEEPCERPMLIDLNASATGSYNFSSQTATPSQCRWIFSGCPAGQGVHFTFHGLATTDGFARLSAYGWGSIGSGKILAEITAGRARQFRRTDAKSLMDAHGQGFANVSQDSSFVVAAPTTSAAIKLVSMTASAAFGVHYRCQPLVSGCMDSSSSNFNANAAYENDGDCSYAAHVEQNPCFVQKSDSSLSEYDALQKLVMPVTASFEPLIQRFTAFNCSILVNGTGAAVDAMTGATTGSFWLRFSGESARRPKLFFSGKKSAFVEGILSSAPSGELSQCADLPKWNGGAFECRNGALCFVRRICVKDKIAAGNGAVATVRDGAVLVMQDVAMVDNFANSFHGVWCHVNTFCDFFRVRVVGNYAGENAGLGTWGIVRARNSTFSENYAGRNTAISMNRNKVAVSLGPYCTVAGVDCSWLSKCQGTGTTDFNCEPQLLLSHSVFDDNVAFGDVAGAIGSGVTGFSSVVKLEDSQLQNNIASRDGGTIFAQLTGSVGSFAGAEQEARVLNIERSSIGVAYASSAMHIGKLPKWWMHSVALHDPQNRTSNKFVDTPDSGAGDCGAFGTAETPTTLYPPCPAAYECQSRRGSAWCSPCPGLTVSSGYTCSTCPQPLVNLQNQSGCMACPPGRASDGSKCVDCPPGKFCVGGQGLGDLQDCPLGREPDSSRTSCIMCSREKYRDCSRCSVHKYGTMNNGSLQAKLVCETCPEPDRQQPNEQGDGCVCKPGYYDSWSGSYPIILQANSKPNIVTPPKPPLFLNCWKRNEKADPGWDFLNHPSETDLKAGHRCIKCPSCVTCTIDHFKEAQAAARERIAANAAPSPFAPRMIIKSGFGLVEPGSNQTASGTIHIFKCPTDSACLTFDLFKPSTERTACKKGHGEDSPLCNTCAEGYSYEMGECKICSRMNYFAMVLLLCLATAITGYVMYLAFKRVDKLATCLGVFRLTWPNVRGAVGILVTNFQILASVEKATSIEMPEVFSDLLDTLRALTQLDFLKLPGLQCVFGRHYYRRLVYKMLSPLMLFLVLMICKKLHIHHTRHHKLPVPPGVAPAQSWKYKLHRSIIIANIELSYSATIFGVIYLLYPSTCQTVFEIFQCRDLKYKEPSLLEADYRLNCYTDEHLWATSFGIFFMFLYPFGIPFYFGYSMWKHRDSIVNSPHYIAVAHFRPLFDPYKPDCFMFEVYFMIEKVVLVGVMGFIDRGGVVQALGNMCVVQYYIMLVNRRFPMKNPVFTKANIFSHCSIMFVYFVTLVLNPAVNLDESRIPFTQIPLTKHHIDISLMVVQGALVVYLGKVILTGLKGKIANAKVQVAKERKAKKFAERQMMMLATMQVARSKIGVNDTERTKGSTKQDDAEDVAPMGTKVATDEQIQNQMKVARLASAWKNVHKQKMLAYAMMSQHANLLSDIQQQHHRRGTAVEQVKTPGNDGAALHAGPDLEAAATRPPTAAPMPPSTPAISSRRKPAEVSITDL